MEASNMLALQNAVSKASKSLDLPPGIYPIDATYLIRLTGGITRHADTTTSPTTSLPLLPILALALQKAGCTRDATLSIILESCRDVLTGKAPATLQDPSISSGVEKLRKAFASSLPSVPRKGQLRCSVVSDISEVIDVSTADSIIASDPDIIAVSRVRAG